MTKEEIKKLASDISKLKKSIKLTGENEKDWGSIRIAIIENQDLHTRLLKTNKKELADKGFLAFALVYDNLLRKAFVTN